MVSTLTPAYGRDYRSKMALIADLIAGKDFVDSYSGKPINLPQIRELGMRQINVRYGQLRKVAVINLETVK